MNKIKIGIALISLLPSITFAAGKDLKYIASLVVDYLNIGLGLIISFAVVTFVWNVYLYFFTEKDKTEAGKYVLFSVIGFFVILSFWGMVALLKNTLNLDNQKPASLNNIGIPSTGGQSGTITNPSSSNNIGTPSTGGQSGTITNP
jgi:hypothetical protein